MKSGTKKTNRILIVHIMLSTAYIECIIISNYICIKNGAYMHCFSISSHIGNSELLSIFVYKPFLLLRRLKVPVL